MGDKDTEPVTAQAWPESSTSELVLVPDSPASSLGVSQEFIPINKRECGMLLPAAVSPPAAAPAALRVTALREGHRQRAACANPTRLCCSAPFFPPLFSSHPKFFSIFFLARHPVSHQHLLAWAGEMLKGEQEVPGCCHCSAPRAGRGSNSAQITSRIFLQFVGLFYYCCYYLFIFF